ncbi:MAG: hypothetical protein MUP33_06095 [Polaromonas sp.]|nr:hypothetical protein [Polaromonas sp.]
MGNILLTERNLEAAGEALQFARDMGVDARQIEPLLAEIAFIEGRYPDVRAHLQRVRSGRSSSRVETIAGYREGEGHAAVFF